VQEIRAREIKGARACNKLITRQH